MAITSTSVSSLSGQRPFKRKFQLQLGGTIMATRGKKKKKTMSRGKKKRR